MNDDDNMDIDNNVPVDPDMDLDCSVPLTTHYIHAHVYLRGQIRGTSIIH